MTLEERKKQSKIFYDKIHALGVEKFSYYSLINNYGYTFIYNNIKYDLRHVLNVYGARVDMWDLYPNTNEKALESIKKLIIEYDKKIIL